jgi:hypothetical protein
LKPKLIALNLLLALGVLAAVWQARVHWDEAKAVRRANLNVPIKPAPAPPLTPSPKPEPAVATRYADVAEKDLFTPDRNPVVIVPPPVVEKPKPMPPLPVVFGVMGLPSGTKAIMAEKSGGPSKAVRAGETIGDFKVLALDTKKVTFEWGDKQLERNIDDLIDRSGNPPGAGGGSAAPQASGPSGPAAPAPPAAQVVNNNPTKTDLGPPSGQNFLCKQGDTAPAGAVVDGFKKTVSQSIFGPVCRWVKQ